MILLATTTDKLQVITSAAVNVDVHASYVDASNANPPVVQGSTMGRFNTLITTATTTDIVAAPASNVIRNVKTINVRNRGSSSVDVTVQFNQNATLIELFKCTMRPNDVLQWTDDTGWFLTQSVVARLAGATADQTGFSADTYLTGSYIVFPSGGPAVLSQYRLEFDMTKTAAGTAAAVLTIRTGTAGTTGDTARHTFTFSAGTAAAETGRFVVTAQFSAVGASGVSRAVVGLTSNPTTGLSSLIKALSSNATAYDTTTANLGIGASFNGGASFSGTVRIVRAEYVHQI